MRDIDDNTKKKYLELESPINSSMFKPIKNTPDYPWRERQRELPREDQISKSNFKNIREIDFTWKRFLSRIKYVMKIFTFFLYVFFRHQTGGYPAKLGRLERSHDPLWMYSSKWQIKHSIVWTFEDVFRYFYFRYNLAVLCNFTDFFVSFVLDETQYIHLITYPLLDGTNAHTLLKDIWDWRAKDEENMDEYHIYHLCKFMLKKGEKEN